jgi:hypothetical protein
MNERQALALADPLNGSDPVALTRRRHVHQAGDGALLIVVLAVDR